MGMLETSYNQFFIGKKRWGVSSWRNIINVQDQYQYLHLSLFIDLTALELLAEDAAYIYIYIPNITLWLLCVQELYFHLGS